MSNMFLYVIYASIFNSMLLIYMIIRNQSSTRKEASSQVTTLNDIRTLLSPETHLSCQLLSRAIPNARLKRAFRIDNSTFVSPDIAVHDNFTKVAKSLISSPGTFSWAHFADNADDSVRAYLHRHLSSERATECTFERFIRVLTLHVVIIGLFRADVGTSEQDFLDVDFVARGINDLWAISKTSSTPPGALLEKINIRLRRWVRTYSNPVEFIIPAYETMWRVVAVTVALKHSDHEARRAFHLFLQQPDSDQFRRFLGEDPSVEAIIQEVLRLYPPTRHISRAVAPTSFQFLPSWVTRLLFQDVIKVADIETLQRADVWGPTAQDFDPMRHHPARCTDEQRRTLLMFGYGKLTCVAKSWAPRAAAIIVAAVLEQVGTTSAFHIIEGPKLGGRGGWDGWIVTRVADDLPTADDVS
ncbi:hypothetical protein AcV5_005577 [Taiwanofungus camphoratus]|nr:hypothetical protein AcV5_005577 [Antrodia cinnamomea]